jgi:spore maturation protein CgeB
MSRRAPGSPADLPAPHDAQLSAARGLAVDTIRALAQADAARRSADAELQWRHRHASWAAYDHALLAWRFSALENSRLQQVSRLLGERGPLRGLLALPGALWRLRRPMAPGPEPAPPDFPRPDAVPPVPDAVEPARDDVSVRGSGPTVLAIVDEISAEGLATVCRLVQPGPGSWRSALEQETPSLLLVESAWSGNGGQWRDRLQSDSPDLIALLDACRHRGIPSVFWNKEDPNHFGHFLPLAAHFDRVLTTAAECVDDYRARLGHDRVGVLSFACAPDRHHPFEQAPRLDAVGFAGSWYARYPERQAWFDAFVAAVDPPLPVRIHDRTLGSGIEEFRYPDRHLARIVGCVSAADIPDVYRDTVFGLNLNTVGGSRTMFARRALELAACNTVVVSNPSPAMSAALGGAVLADADPGAAAEQVLAIAGDEAARHRLRLRARRAVLAEHTWEKLFAALLSSCALPVPATDGGVDVVLLADAGTAPGLMARVAAQSLAPVRIWWAGEGPAPEGAAGAWPPGDPALLAPLVAVMRAADHHGPHYLRDLHDAAVGPGRSGVGKLRRWVWRGAPVLDGLAQVPFRSRGQAPAWCSLLPGNRLLGLDAVQLAGLARFEVIAADEFGYCEDGGYNSAACASQVDA